ncbi:MAG: YARHG domain-containing protein, partial [Spirochaetaceae bacterium]|nr:YARHG domain-containing protein [Spirochaetaceae bacterium]
MKKIVLIAAFIFASAAVWAQRGQAGEVLQGYDGYWTRQGRITIFNLVRFYPDRLPFLRNEIYARYGRPFASAEYQAYFNSQSWYRVRNNYTDNWLSADDRHNAEFIRSVEQAAPGFEDTVKTLLQNVEYQGDDFVLIFSSKQNLLVQRGDRDSADVYGRNIEEEWWSWIVMGDWVIAYRDAAAGNYEAAAYQLNHGRRRITGSAHTTINAASLNV